MQVAEPELRTLAGPFPRVPAPGCGNRAGEGLRMAGAGAAPVAGLASSAHEVLLEPSAAPRAHGSTHGSAFAEKPGPGLTRYASWVRFVPVLL